MYLDPVYIIVEYLAKGDLKNNLMGYRDKEPGRGYSNVLRMTQSLSQTLIKFARDVANGMAFLSAKKVNFREINVHPTNIIPIRAPPAVELSVEGARLFLLYSVGVSPTASFRQT